MFEIAKMARGSWLVARGSWLVARGSWLVARGSWLVGVLHSLKSFINNSHNLIQEILYSSA